MCYKKAFAVLSLMALLTACGNTEVSDNDEVEAAQTAFSDPLPTHEDEIMVSNGYFMPCTNGMYMVISETMGEMVISPDNDDYSIFDDLTVGDTVTIHHSLVLETYPEQVTVYYIEKISDGDKSDIPSEKLAYLEELGWTAITDEIPQDTPDCQVNFSIVETVPQCKPSMGFSFMLPEGWSYQEAQTDDVPTSCTAVYLKPDDTKLEGVIAIEYSKGFSVCGTGLKEINIDFNGHKAVQGSYDGHDLWAFIALKGEYSDCVIMNSAEWYEEYADTIDTILSSIEFKYYE
ncbi:MAG: hypothetical protein ACI4SF_07380 [Oscillospiraceae bacterium]